jgi:hypothetical protein
MRPAATQSGCLILHKEMIAYRPAILFADEHDRQLVIDYGMRRSPPFSLPLPLPSTFATCCYFALATSPYRHYKPPLRLISTDWTVPSQYLSILHHLPREVSELLALRPWADGCWQYGVSQGSRSHAGMFPFFPNTSISTAIYLARSLPAEPSPPGLCSSDVVPLQLVP